jgi:alpha-L-fucosidase
VDLALEKMGKSGSLGARALCWSALMLCVFQVASAALPNCSYAGVFAFGDSLSDTGNSIAAFPNKFANAELDPNGILFPTHAADRFTDGKLLVDFLGT